MTREKYSDPAVYQALVDRLPLSKRGTGDDIAQQAVFLVVLKQVISQVN